MSTLHILHVNTATFLMNSKLVFVDLHYIIIVGILCEVRILLLNRVVPLLLLSDRH